MEATNNNQGYVSLTNAPELIKLLEDIFTDEFMQQHTRTRFCEVLDIEYNLSRKKTIFLSKLLKA